MSLDITKGTVSCDDCHSTTEIVEGKRLPVGWLQVATWFVDGAGRASEFCSTECLSRTLLGSLSEKCKYPPTLTLVKGESREVTP